MSDLAGLRPRSPLVCLVLCLALAAVTQAQVPGRNVNMVSGTGWPDGDPFLQRQNEPSVAVSSRNPMHLLAGANDYRTVDLPGLPDDLVTGDAWLGVFASYDGGATWRSTLLPGYPQDLAATPPLWGFEAGADPTVRAGTHGLFYYSGIAFDRDNPVIMAKMDRKTPRTALAGVGGATSAVFVARFIDNNHQENANPIAYLNTAVVADNVADPLVFLDKPWMAVDGPRKGAGTCDITQELDDEIVTQSIPAGNVYIAFSQFTGTGDDVLGQIMFTRSVDCGVTWSTPVAISGPHHINQGATIAIDPKKGAVHVAWRRFTWPRNVATPTEDNAILIAHSFDAGLTFTPPEVVAEFEPFDQGTGDKRFRTNAYPTVAVDRKSRVFVAFTSRDLHPSGDARILVTQARRPSDTTAWPSPILVDPDLTRRGHQIMPTAVASGDRLQIAYVDLQEDHTWALHARDADGQWYETRVISTERTSLPNNVFNAVVDDSTVLYRRHTADVWVAQAAIADQPAFLTRRVSDYRVGSHPNRPQQIEQLQFNPPNLPLFRQGTAPFWGDYIDIGALAYVPKKPVDKKDRWEAPKSTDASYVVFTDNRDVRPPADHVSWDVYTPPFSPALDPTQSLHDPNSVPPPCDPASSERTGMRNQNIYLARVTQGLFVGIPGNAKPLGQIQRAFVVFVENTTFDVKTFRVSIPVQPEGGFASFDQFSSLTAIDIAVAPRSSVSRTFFVTAPDSRASIDILVQETVNGDVLPVAEGGLEGTATVNPDMINPNMINPNMINPDMINVDILTTEVHTPNMINPDMINFEPEHPNMINPDMINPDAVTPDMINPDMINFQADNPNMINPNMINPNMINPNMINPNMINAAVTDSMWKITNVGNTTSAYDIRLALRNTIVPEGFWTQLILHKTYLTPSAKDCQLLEESHNVLVATIDQPRLDQLGDPIDYDPTDSSVQHATLWLAPGESGWITFRVIDPDKNDEVTFDPRTSVVSTVLAQAVNSDDAAGGVTEGDSASSSSIIFLDRPRSTPVGGIMTPPQQVLVQDDATGDPRAGELVTLTLDVNPGGATLYGSTATTNLQGIAAFDSLWLNRVGTGYQLLAQTATATSDRSAPFDITGFVVTSLDDSGPGTLRNAIEIANATVSQPDAIAFDIPGPGPYVISPLSPLPIITDPLVIDGTTQPGYAGVPLVQLEGNGTGASGLVVQSTTATVRGLVVTSFGLTGIRLENATASSVEQSYIGTNGTADLGNGDHGITIAGGAGNRVHACVVSGNTRNGVLFSATTDAEVTASRIGTTADGSASLPNTWSGVDIEMSSFVRVGTGAPGAGNLISGNTVVGIEITRPGDNVSGVLIAGNLIGTDATGTSALPNGSAGISAYGEGGVKEDITIGGPTSDFRNIISGNNSQGIQLIDTDRVAILGNYIGLGATGNALGNGFAGMTITDTRDTMIGTATAGNVISSNPVYGIYLAGSGSTPTTIQGNKVGTDPTGTSARGNMNCGIQVVGSAANVIGGAAPGEGNLVSGNGIGIRVEGSFALGNVIRGNLIGTTVDGQAPLGNTVDGLVVRDHADYAMIGGTAPGSRNVISGNFRGIYLEEVTGVDVQGNYIGTDLTGMLAVPNTSNGIGAYRMSGSTFGGTTPAARNIISGNGAHGVMLAQPTLMVNNIQGNYIGVDATGGAALANTGNGIYVTTTGNQLIGGSTPGSGNVISGNLGHGIGVEYSDANVVVTGNLIGTNALGSAGVGNVQSGVSLQGPDAALVTVRANVIAGNGGAGVALGNGAHHNTVAGNKIGTDAAGAFAIGNSGGVSLYRSVHDNTIGGPARSDSNVISGNAGFGVSMSSSTTAPVERNLVRGNFIGIDFHGTVAIPNEGDGVWLGEPMTSDNTLRDNVISGNLGNGVHIVEGSQNKVLDNKIGTDATGTAALGNGQNGVYTHTDADRSTIGLPIEGNLISGNGQSGIKITSSNNNIVQGNMIGTDTTGTAAIPNLGHGLDLRATSSDTLGGDGAYEGNLISGNLGDGLYFAFGVGGAVVEGNRIGTDAAGTSPLPNRAGIRLLGDSSGNTFGGASAGAANLIAFNTESGIHCEADTGTSNTFKSNSIHSNDGVGIDLGGDGVTPNDAGDGDVGPNDLLNTPIVTAAGSAVVPTQVYFGIKTEPFKAVTVELFHSPSCDASTYGEGQTQFGTWALSPGASGVAGDAFLSSDPIPAGSYVTATATDADGNTSEFSQCVQMLPGVACTNDCTAGAPDFYPCDTCGGGCRTGVCIGGACVGEPCP